jgi:Protein of unknown function (DUF3105)
VAKKDRVPTPPKRPVQAPKPYHQERDTRRSRLIFIGVGVVLLLAAAAVGLAFVLTGGDDDASGRVGSSGDCEVQTFDAIGRTHVEEALDDSEYNSLPATSGNHSPQTAIWNLYDQPVPQFHAIHNLEHGGVIVQYGSDVPAATVSQISDWYQEDPRGLIVAPMPSELEEEDATLADQVVLTAWTHMMRCSAFDEEAFGDFIDDYRGPQGDAPEKFPLDSLQQGSN